MNTRLLPDLQTSHPEADQPCRASIRLSRLTKLPNADQIEGESGSIQGEIYNWGSFIQCSTDGKEWRARTDDRPKRFKKFGHRLIDNFVEILVNGAELLISGRDVLPSIEIFDACYAQREQFGLPRIDASEQAVDG
jgi:predicted dehydrogenase